MELYIPTTYKVVLGDGIDKSRSPHFKRVMCDVADTFGVEIIAGDWDDDEWEVSRKDLEWLKNLLSGKDPVDDWKAWMNDDDQGYLERILAQVPMTLKEFVDTLNTIITTSDQDNDFVVFCWY